DQILPTEDHDVAKEVEKQLKRKGVTVVKNAKVLADTLQKDSGVTINAEIGDSVQSFSADKILVSVGRQANVTNIGLENTDIEVEKGVIKTSPFYQTKEAHIYAI